MAPLTVHPTVRAELAIAAAVFCVGAAIGALVEASNLLARARRAEREQLRNAGQLVEQLADECDELRAEMRAADALQQKVDDAEPARLLELRSQLGDAAAALDAANASIAELREQRDGQGRRADRYARLIAFAREHGPEVVGQTLEAAEAAMAVADGTVTALPRHIVRAAIEQADDGELLRDAIARERQMPFGPGDAPPCQPPCRDSMSACDGLGHGCPHVDESERS